MGLVAAVEAWGANTASSLATFDTKNDHLTKTVSGQT
jgi:hypothetical protein